MYIPGQFLGKSVHGGIRNVQKMNVNQAHTGFQRVDIFLFTLALDCCICPSIFYTFNSGSGPAASASGNLLEMQILGPMPDVIDQKLWEWSPAICGVTGLPGDSSVP